MSSLEKLHIGLYMVLGNKLITKCWLSLDSLTPLNIELLNERGAAARNIKLK